MVSGLGLMHPFRKIRYPVLRDRKLFVQGTKKRFITASFHMYFVRHICASGALYMRHSCENLRTKDGQGLVKG